MIDVMKRLAELDKKNPTIVKENQQVADYVNENDMTGLGNYIYLKAYDYAHKLATQQAEREFHNGDLNEDF